MLLIQSCDVDVMVPLLSISQMPTSSPPTTEENYGAGVRQTTYTLMDYVVDLSDRYDILMVQASLENQCNPFINRIISYIF